VLPIVRFFGLRQIARQWLRRHPRADGAEAVVTLTGHALYGCLTLVLLSVAAFRQLEPREGLGQFLNRPTGLPAGIRPTAVFSPSRRSVAHSLRPFLYSL
jgi:hypothetical protein